jgi:hypothetical protein
MKAVERRLARLENGFRPLSGPSLLIITRAGQRLALDKDTCIQILREGGFIRATGLVPVDLIDVPGGLNAAELQKYLLENGSKMVGPRGLTDIRII